MELPARTAPRIETERLVLHAHSLDDFDDSAAMWAEPEVTRFIGGVPFPRSEVWLRLLRYAGHWSLLGYGFWAVRERASGRFAGEVGFADMRRELKHDFDGAPEIGWALAPWAHGRGFATEAVRAVIAWGDANLQASRTVCMIEPGNRASLRVAGKCGYGKYADATYKGVPILLFQRTRATERRPPAV